MSRGDNRGQTMRSGGEKGENEGSEAKRSVTERSGAPSTVAAQASYFVVPRLIAFQNGSVQNRLLATILHLSSFQPLETRRKASRWHLHR